MEGFYNKEKGMSVIELLITVFLIVIILTAVTVVINPIKRKAQAEDYRRFNDVQLIAKAIKEYFYMGSGKDLMCGDGPLLSDDKWYCIGQGPCIDPALSACDIGYDLVPSYIAVMPLDPTNNNWPADCGYAIKRNTDSRQIYIMAPYQSKHSNSIDSTVVVY
jgi:type II secretory pathway pseudopilin PulG